MGLESGVGGLDWVGLGARRAAGWRAAQAPAWQHVTQRITCHTGIRNPAWSCGGGWQRRGVRLESRAGAWRGKTAGPAQGPLLADMCHAPISTSLHAHHCTQTTAPHRAENLAEFTIAGRWEGALNIIGTAAPQPTPQVRAGRVTATGPLGAVWCWWCGCPHPAPVLSRLGSRLHCPPAFSTFANLHTHLHTPSHLYTHLHTFTQLHTNLYTSLQRFAVVP